jgi:hypothetical protein
MDKADREEIKCLQSEANTPKNKLMDIMRQLERAGAIRQANSLGTIIGKLEAWQRK